MIDIFGDGLAFAISRFASCATGATKPSGSAGGDCNSGCNSSGDSTGGGSPGEPSPSAMINYCESVICEKQGNQKN